MPLVCLCLVVKTGSDRWLAFYVMLHAPLFFLFLWLFKNVVSNVYDNWQARSFIWCIAERCTGWVSGRGFISVYGGRFVCLFVFFFLWIREICKGPGSLGAWKKFDKWDFWEAQCKTAFSSLVLGCVTTSLIINLWA